MPTRRGNGHGRTFLVARKGTRAENREKTKKGGKIEGDLNDGMQKEAIRASWGAFKQHSAEKDTFEPARDALGVREGVNIPGKNWN